jgi:hypothetical protein
MTSNIVDLPSAKRRYTEPLTVTEQLIFGADAERCPETGFIFESGSGAHPRSVQTALFKRNLADSDWVAKYKASDPHARILHPELFE